jgi:integrase
MEITKAELYDGRGQLKGKVLDLVLEGKRTLPIGRYSDTRNLFLLVKGPRAISWTFAWKIGGKRQNHGMGSFIGNGPTGHRLSLKEARLKADEIRVGLAAGKHPIKERRKVRLDLGKSQTFGEVLNSWLPRIEKAKNWAPATGRGIKRLLALHASWLLNVNVQEIDREMVLKLVEPLREIKPQTAENLRNRIKQVLEAAGRTGTDNPADWLNLKGALIVQQPGEKENRKALPWRDAPTFFAELRQREDTASKALQLVMLCATRSKEIFAAKWKEIDLDRRVWTVPVANRKKIKAKTAMKSFPIPLSDAAVELLRSLPMGGPDDPIFIGPRSGRELRNDALRDVMRAMGWKDADGEIYDVHGFRGCFRDWAPRSSAKREIIEVAMQHTVKGVEGDYWTDTAIDLRRPLMDEWAAYLTSPAADVLPLRRAS